MTAFIATTTVTGTPLLLRPAAPIDESAAVRWLYEQHDYYLRQERAVVRWLWMDRRFVATTVDGVIVDVEISEVRGI